MSRTPLREALRILLAEGLVVQKSTGGLLVSPLDPQDMRELYAVRAALEGLLAREASDRVTSIDEVALAELLEQMRLLVDHPRDLARLGRQFHDRLAQASGNRRGQQLLRQIHGQVRRYQVLTNRQTPRRRDTLDEHRTIFEAVVAREGELAEQRMRVHIMAAYGTAAAALESAPRGGRGAGHRGELTRRLRGPDAPVSETPACLGCAPTAHWRNAALCQPDWHSAALCQRGRCGPSRAPREVRD